MKKWLAACVAVLAILYFGHLIRQSKPEQIIQLLGQLGFSVFLLFLPFVLVYGFDTAGWYWCFQGEPGGGLSYWQIVPIRWAGEAVNNALPLGLVGGEALKVYLLTKRELTTLEGAASIFVSKTIQTLSQVLLLFISSLLYLRTADTTTTLRWVLVFVILGFAALALAAVWLQSRGFLSALTGVMGKYFKADAKGMDSSHAQELDKKVADYFRERPRAFYYGFLCYFIGWALGALEIWLMAKLTGLSVSLEQALVLESLIPIFKATSVFVPGAMGIQESGIALVGTAITIPDKLALSYALFRRLRELTFVAIGLAMLATLGVTKGELEALKAQT